MSEPQAPPDNATVIFRLSRKTIDLARVRLPNAGPWPHQVRVELPRFSWLLKTPGGRSSRLHMLRELVEGARERRMVMAPPAAWEQLLKAHPRITNPDSEVFCVQCDREPISRRAALVGFDPVSGAFLFRVQAPSPNAK